MAKPENPAEGSSGAWAPQPTRGAPSAARPPRPVQRVRLEASLEPHRAGAREAGAVSFDPLSLDAASLEAASVDVVSLHPADVDPADVDPAEDDFDTRRNLAGPGTLANRELFSDRELLVVRELGAHEFSDEELAADDELLPEHEPSGGSAGSVAARQRALAAREALPESRGDRPGLAWVRPGTGSGVRGALEVPVANLEPPSTSRFDLTPSPVPRVALAPATGSVDVSLVPGPHAAGSRNMPTLAAQHVLGRRPRRPAAAVTLPPPAPAFRESRVAAGLARDVRSSKGEIVLGLMIGLGVSLLLAGLGQAYLRGDGAIAEEQSAPVDSVTLRATPDALAGLPAAVGVASTASNAADPSAAVSNPTALSAGAEAPASSPSTAASLGAASLGAASLGAVPAPGEAPALTGAVRTGDDGALLAQARTASAKRASRPLPRATPVRATRAQRGAAAEPLLSEEAADADKSRGAAPSEREPSPAPLTPAQSAGLGLDLPF